MVKGPTNTFARFLKTDIEQSIPMRFERQAIEHPTSNAVRTRSHAWTYDQLNRFANEIARVVIERRGEATEPTALLLDQSAPLVASILGVLKANKFYVPLDPVHPPSGLRHMMADSQAQLVITDRSNLHLAKDLAGQLCEVLVAEDFLQGERMENPGLTVDPCSLAYIFYTSGSTGRPKGVMDTHRNVLHNIMRYTNNLHISADDRLTLLQFCSFSGSVSSLFCALLNGGCSLPFDLHKETPDRLAEYLVRERITIYHSVPSIFRSFLNGRRKFPDVRVVRLEGDQASKIDAELFRQYFNCGCFLVNGLGTTETGIVRQYFMDGNTPLPEGHIPVGYPIEDMQIMLLDGGEQQVPMNEIGEIAVRSEYLASGYWGNPELTRTAFLPDHQSENKRIYRTGDLGRMRQDGCLELLGRNDSRVKIRGNPVDMAEVELALLSNPEIKEAVVLPKENHRGEQRLIAYLVAAGKVAPSASSIRLSLVNSLPSFMIPSDFVFLSALPLTEYRKIDRKALPPLDDRPARVDSTFLAARGDVEWRLIAIWEEVLGVRPIDVRDDFFESGGHSLLAGKLLDRIAQTFGKELPLASFLGASTIERQARLIRAEKLETQRNTSARDNDSSNPIPFFYLGGSPAFRWLSMRLSASREFHSFGLHPSMVRDLKGPNAFSSVAEQFVRAIRECRPQGPYALGGWCDHGLLAMETAQQLRAQGQEVALLVMIETFSPGFENHFQGWQRFSSHLHLKLHRLEFEIAYLRQMTRARALGYVVDRVKQIVTRINQLDVFYSAAASYRAEPYLGPVVLIRCKKRALGFARDLGLGWGDLIGERLEICEVPGNHYTLYMEPNVGTLVREINARL